jgi:Na+/H+ antiporter NhaD/arsenite permease-like protein
MFYLIIAIFILGYTAIALEHTISINKAASALLTAVLVWVCIVLGKEDIYSASEHFQHYQHLNPGASVIDFITQNELIQHLGSVSEILFFLLGAMTVVEVIDTHGGFNVLSRFITTTNKVKLLWIISFVSFFMSAVLDNLTTTIVMIALMRKLIGGKHTRWFFASMIVIAANAGGAWSPIGDVTTIMLWIGGQITALAIILKVFLPSLVCMVVPLIIVSLTLKGKTIPPSRNDRSLTNLTTTDKERLVVLCAGVGGLLFVPVFKTLTHLPPYLGVLLVLALMWVLTELMHKGKQRELKSRLTLAGIIQRIDTPTILFFLGILLAVAGLESAGHLGIFSQFLDEKIHNVYAINVLIGALSSVVDNVPLVAATMGMYHIPAAEAIAATPYLANFVTDGIFWELLAYCAGTGGSMLIIGSAAGVAAMGILKIDFIWYLKKITLLAATGYLAGVGAYYLIYQFLG